MFEGPHAGPISVYDYWLNILIICAGLVAAVIVCLLEWYRRRK